MKLSREQFIDLALEQIDVLYRVARRLTGSPERAEDLVQDTYVRALGAADGFDLQQYGIRPWLLRILHNLHLNQGQREARQPTAMADDGLDSAAGLVNPGPPIDPSSFENMDEHLVRALESLPGEYSTVLLLWAVDELSYQEIAASLGVPIGTVMSRLHRARQRLAERLHGFAVAERIIRE